MAPRSPTTSLLPVSVATAELAWPRTTRAWMPCAMMASCESKEGPVSGGRSTLRWRRRAEEGGASAHPVDDPHLDPLHRPRQLGPLGALRVALDGGEHRLEPEVEQLVARRERVRLARLGVGERDEQVAAHCTGGPAERERVSASARKAGRRTRRRTGAGHLGVRERPGQEHVAEVAQGTPCASAAGPDVSARARRPAERRERTDRWRTAPSRGCRQLPAPPQQTPCCRSCRRPRRSPSCRPPTGRRPARRP